MSMKNWDPIPKTFACNIAADGTKHFYKWYATQWAGLVVLPRYFVGFNAANN